MTPICLFVYKRVDTTKLLLESLLRCPECHDSELHVFMDGPRDNSETCSVEAVRRLFDGLTEFRELHLHPAPTNKGLARSVIDGVTEVLDRHSDVIVLEDDLIVAADFLTFMNEALIAYRKRSDIWSISGYTPNLKELEGRQGVFLVPRAQCWGWATWKDRWYTVDWEVNDYNELVQSRVLRKNFDRGGDDLFRTLQMERNGRIESWAVRWAYAAAKQDQWTVNPTHSKVHNIGMTRSDGHGGWHDRRHDVELHGEVTTINPDVVPDPALVKAFKEHHDLGLISRIGYFMRLHNLGYDTIKRMLKSRRTCSL